MATTATSAYGPSRMTDSTGSVSALRKTVFVLVLLAVPTFFVLELTIGTTVIPLVEVLRALSGAETSRESWKDIVLVLRLPRAITAMVASAALAAGGLLMQTVFRNPLAGPWVLGNNRGRKAGRRDDSLSERTGHDGKRSRNVGCSGQYESCVRSVRRGNRGAGDHGPRLRGESMPSPFSSSG